jgi:hypothetical protein
MDKLPLAELVRLLKNDVDMSHRNSDKALSTLGYKLTQGGDVY